MLFALLLSSAFAGSVEAWSVKAFPEDYLDGWDGWESGWNEDAWFGFEYDGQSFASPIYDENDNGSFGDGGAHDNWLVNPAADVVQGEFVVSTYADDDDAWGVIFDKTEDHYFMFLFCGPNRGGSNTDCPLENMDTPGSALIEVTNGNVDVIEGSGVGFDFEEAVDVSIENQDGTVTVTYGDLAYSMTTPADFAVNGVGFYGYNQGQYEGGQDDGSSTYFYNPVLYASDDDDDKVVDDDDNCEKVANADQADADLDGIGTACDDSEPSGGDTGNDTGNGNGNGTGGDGSGLDAPGLSAPGLCSCAVTDPTAGAALLALATLAAARRRRG